VAQESGGAEKQDILAKAGGKGQKERLEVRGQRLVKDFVLTNL
jgi:hypothetical protein